MLRQDAELNPDAYNHAQVRIVYSLQTPCRNLLLQMYSMLLSTIHASTVNGTTTMARHAVYVVGAHSDVDGDLVVIRRPPPSRSSSIVRVGPHIRVALYVPCVYLSSNPTVTIGSNRHTLCRILVRGSSTMLQRPDEEILDSSVPLSTPNNCSVKFCAHISPQEPFEPRESIHSTRYRDAFSYGHSLVRCEIGGARGEGVDIGHR